MRELVIAVALMVAQPAFANEADTVARRLAGLSIDNMTVAYACRSAIGDGHYRLARTMAVENGVAAGMGRSDAVLAVSNLDRKIQEEAAANATAPASAKDCFSRLSDITFGIRAALANLQRIAG